MKILIASWTESRVGGAESYLNAVLPALCEQGHEVACLFETEIPGREPIALPGGCRSWTFSPELLNVALKSEVQAWKPSIVYCHGLLNAKLERWLQALAPSVLLAHGYYGTCISGTKTLTNNRIRPCKKKFGISCLAMYMPCGCGGKNPLTMWQDFRSQRARLALLSTYKIICTASKHMAQEFARHLEVDPTQVMRLPLSESALPAAERRSMLDDRLDTYCRGVRPVRLLFLGRIESNKGAQRATEVAPLIARQLQRPVELTFIGEGTLVEGLRAETKPEATVKIIWQGWMRGAGLEREIGRHDLLLVPSLWPEPFALVGLEAGRFGVPAASFGTGGIPEWLLDGETGALTTGNCNSAEALAAASVGCLADSTNHRRLSENAYRFSNAWPDATTHTKDLIALFDSLLVGSR